MANPTLSWVIYLTVDGSSYSKKESKNSEITSLSGKYGSISFLVLERGPNADVVGPSNGNSRPGNRLRGRARGCLGRSCRCNSEKVWFGGIDGGLWMTNDILPTRCLDTYQRFFGNLAVASITQDPTG